METAKTRVGACKRAIKAMRDLGLVEARDEPLITELLVMATDLDRLEPGHHTYPQLVNLYHEVEVRVVERMFPEVEVDDGPGSLADRLSALRD